MLDIWVAQVVEPDAGQTGAFQQGLQVAVGPAGIDRVLRVERIGEDPLGAGAFPPFPQQLSRAGRQGDGAPALSRLGLAGGHSAALALVERPAHCQRPLLPVEVGPHQPADLTPAHPGGQLSVEEIAPDRVLFDLLHEPLQLLVVEDLLGGGLLFGEGDILRGVSRREPLPHRRVHGLVEHTVETADGRAGERVPVLGMLGLAPVLLHLPVQGLHVSGSHLAHRPVPQPGLDVALDVLPVTLQRGLTHHGRDVLLQPAVQPLSQRHPAILAQVHIPVLLDALVQLFHQGLLTFGGDVAEDGLAVLLVAHHDAALPASVLPFAHHAVAGRSALCHLLFTSTPNITVIFIHALDHQPGTQSETQNKVFSCRDAVDLML